MGVLGSDTFTKPNQSGLGLATDGVNTWASQRGSSAYGVTSNKGTVANNSGSYDVNALGSISVADSEQVIFFIMANSGDAFGLTARYQDTGHWYFSDIGNNGQKAEIGVDNGGSFTFWQAAFTWSTGVRYGMRFRVTGNAFALRVWNADTSPEPTNWTVTTTDSTITSAGKVGIACDPATSTAIQFDTYSVTDAIQSLSDTVTTTESITSTGTVTDSNTATATESTLSTGTSTLAESVSTQDSASMQSSATDSSTDTATEQATAQGTLAPMDTVATLDTLTLTSIFSISESIVCVSSPNIQGQALSSSTSIATELWSILASLGFVETGQATELASMPSLFIVVDTSALSDSISFVPPVVVAIPAMHIRWITDDMSLNWTTDDMHIAWKTED